MSSITCKYFLSFNYLFSIKQEESKVDEQIKEFESRKNGYFNSMKGMFGYGST
jgi:hypothetical protein